MTEVSKPKVEYVTVDYRNGHRGIFVYCEIIEGELQESGIEVLGEATRMAKKLGDDCRISAVIIGSGLASSIPKRLITSGADRVIKVEGEDFSEYSTRPFAYAIVELVKKYNPEIFLFTASTFGRDLAPRVAARLEVGLSADCIEFDIGGYENRPRKERFEKVAHFIRPSYAESKLATIIGPWTFPQMATARPGALKPIESDPNRTGEVISETIT